MIPGVAEQEKQDLELELRRILIVDEALPVRRKLTEMLHRSGVSGSQIKAFEDADTALESFALTHPDLVFAELVGDEGQEGLRMILEMLNIYPQVRLVLVTAEPADSPLVRRAIRAGVFSVVQKPLRHDKVRAVLTELENEEGLIDRFR